jgi:predicted ATPase
MTPQRQLCEHLADRRVLLVLDNFEQLLSRTETGEERRETGEERVEAQDGAGLLAELLRAAPEVKLLVTSRERLDLRDEWLLPLSGLALPPDPQTESLRGAGFALKQSQAQDEIASSQQPFLAMTDDETAPMAESTPVSLDLEAHAATQLFLHCARRVRPDLQPNVDAALLIVRICRLVDGLPLAIELTAPWVRALPLAEIARRLEAGLDLLATTHRDVPARHRSMRAAFDHSWRLLTPHERSILRQLAVFRGGCTAEATEAVAGATVRDLAGLADKSWLRAGPDGRYDLHELVRQYCAERLAAEHERQTGETSDQVRHRHAAYFAALAAPYERTFQPATKGDWRDLMPELSNLEVAWLTVVEQRDAERLRQLLPFAGLNELLGRYRPLLHFLDAAFPRLQKAWEQEQYTDRAPKTALMLAHVCWGKASKLVSLDQFADVLVAADAGLAFLERAERCALWQAIFVFLRICRAMAISHLGDPAGADRLLLEVSDYLDTAEARRWLARPEVTLPRWQNSVNLQRSYALPRLGRWTEALRLTEQAAAYFVADGTKAMLPLMWNGFILYLQGDYGEARWHVQTALEDWQTRGDREGISTGLAHLAEIEAATGEVGQAREHFRRGLAIARAIDRNGLVCFCLEGLGRLELELGRPARAAEPYRQSLAFIEHMGMVRDYHTPIALAGAGRAVLAQGQLAAAKDYQRQALRCPVYWVHDRIEAVATLAQIYALEGDVLRAVELLAFAVAHSATAHRVRQPMARLLAELEAELPAERFSAAVARGRARELDEVVAELVG